MRDLDTNTAGPKKQLKLGDVPQYTPEGGSNYIEINGKTCTHAVAWPEDGQTRDTLPPPARPGPAAKEFPFTLDPFQRTAINCLEAGETLESSPSPRAGIGICAESLCMSIELHTGRNADGLPDIRTDHPDTQCCLSGGVLWINP